MNQSTASRPRRSPAARSITGRRVRYVRSLAELSENESVKSIERVRRRPTKDAPFEPMFKVALYKTSARILALRDRLAPMLAALKNAGVIER